MEYKKLKDLGPDSIEKWAKKVDKLKRRPLTQKESSDFLTHALNQANFNNDEELIKLLEDKKGGMASLIWLRIKYAHTYEITPGLAIYLRELISSPGIAVMICNYLQYKAHEYGYKVISFEDWGARIFAMGYIDDNDWRSAWDDQKIERDEKHASDNMLDYSEFGKSIKIE